MRNFKIKIKCTQEVTLELPATAYGEDPEAITAEQIADMEEQNVLSDPTYFDSCDNQVLEQENGCLCQGCGNRYKVDLNIPDELWEQIKPINKPEGSGLLCPACIGKRLEQIGIYQTYQLTGI